MKKTIQTVLEEEDVDQLKIIADKKGHTLSSLIRHIIKVFLEGENQS